MIIRKEKIPFFCELNQKTSYAKTSILNLFFRALVITILTQYTVNGYCESNSSWLDNLLGGRKMSQVAAEVAVLEEEEIDYVGGSDFSPDGNYLAISQLSSFRHPSRFIRVHIWDWKNKKIIHSLQSPMDAGALVTKEPIRYSPSGKFLAICHERSRDNIVIRIWNTSDWEVERDLVDKAPGGCRAIDFTPDGKYLLRLADRPPASLENNLVVYSTESWEPIWGIRTTPYYPNAIAISPDGKYAATMGSVINPDPNFWFNGIPIPTFGTPPIKDTGVLAIVDIVGQSILRTIETSGKERLAWSVDGQKIAMCGGYGVDVIELKSEAYSTHESLKAAHMFVRYTSDGKYLIESDGNGRDTGLGVQIWDEAHRNLLQTIPGNIDSLNVSRDGRYFAFSVKEKIFVFKLY
ncbi:MAG: hypothetical protein EKK46_06145 [Rhodocyclaceae bacterium]|nr:MAG: hypothetical protein EKK46_06145 [Rhodocyclaceae bacterium]